MAERSRHPVALALVLTVLLLVAFAAVGCGSDSQGDTPISSEPAPVQTVPATAPSGEHTEALVGTQLITTPRTPTEYVEAVQNMQPVVILFYVPAGVDDQKVLTAINDLQFDFPDYVFLIYDFADPQAYGDLSTLLKVDYPPAVILVDQTGTIDAAWNGYVDEGTLNQELVNLDM